MKSLFFLLALLAIPAASSAQVQPASPDLGLSADSSESLAAKKVALLGIWTVRVRSLENKLIKISFDKDNRFKFVCPGARSEGTYEIRRDKIVLTYLKVDGEPVEFEMKKSLPLAPTVDSFEVDSYHYERASEDVKA